jgi:hypothetical protein
LPMSGDGVSSIFRIWLWAKHGTNILTVTWTSSSKRNQLSAENSIHFYWKIKLKSKLEEYKNRIIGSKFN